MTDFGENGEQLRLSIDIPAEHAEGLKAHIVEFAAAHTFEVEFTEDSPPQLEIANLDDIESLLIHPSGLFNWVKDPGTGKYTPVVTQQNLEFFYSNYESHTLRGSPVRTLMNGLTDYHKAAEEENFMLFDGEEVLGIKMYSALDLLRRLKHEEMGIEYGESINRVIPFVGQGSVRFLAAFARIYFHE